MAERLSSNKAVADKAEDSLTFPPSVSAELAKLQHRLTSTRARIRQGEAAYQQLLTSRADPVTIANTEQLLTFNKALEEITGEEIELYNLSRLGGKIEKMQNLLASISPERRNTRQQAALRLENLTSRGIALANQIRRWYNLELPEWTKIINELPTLHDFQHEVPGMDEATAQLENTPPTAKLRSKPGPKSKAQTIAIRELLKQYPDMPARNVCRLLDSKFGTDPKKYPSLTRPKFAGKQYPSWQDAYSDRPAASLIDSLISRNRPK